MFAPDQKTVMQFPENKQKTVKVYRFLNNSAAIKMIWQNKIKKLKRQNQQVNTIYVDLVNINIQNKSMLKVN